MMECCGLQRQIKLQLLQAYCKSSASTAKRAVTPGDVHVGSMVWSAPLSARTVKESCSNTSMQIEDET